MRHRNRRSKLSMKTAQRDATMRNMAKALLKHQRVEMITARAKQVRRLVEHLITLGKADDVASRRMAFDILTDRDVVGKLFKEIAPLFKNRGSGYTRIIPVGFRRGDGAELCILELTEKNIVEKLPKKKKVKETKPEEGHGSRGKGQIEEKETVKEEHKHKEEPKIKSIPKSKPSLDEEKMREKAKSEDKKLADKKGFMKNIRGLFRKRGDF